MRQRNITPENTEFVILSFEGPDGYSLAGDLGVRVNYLSATLARMGFTTHLFFVGDPRLPGAADVLPPTNPNRGGGPIVREAVLDRMRVGGEDR